MALTMKRLDRLVAGLSARPSTWSGNSLDLAAVARKARVDHAVETLTCLGYEDLAAELLRLERDRRLLHDQQTGSTADQPSEPGARPSIPAGAQAEAALGYAVAPLPVAKQQPASKYQGLITKSEAAARRRGHHVA